MAFVYEKNGKCFLRYKDINKRWVTKASHARTKTEAKLLVGELQRKIEQEQIGLRVAGASMTVAQLFAWWLETYSSQSASHEKNESTIRVHILSHPIAAITLRELSSGHIETFLHFAARQN